MGKRRLIVNKASFGKKKIIQEGDNGIQGKQLVCGIGAKVLEGKTFKSALTKVQDQNLYEEQRCVEVVPTETRLNVLEKCFVAELSYHREAKSVQNSLVMEGIKNVRVTTMGDNLVLLQVEDPVRFELDRKEHGQWWSVVFKDIKRWSPQLVASRRRVWLKVYGISMHMWEEGFFKQI